MFDIISCHCSSFLGTENSLLFLGGQEKKKGSVQPDREEKAKKGEWNSDGDFHPLAGSWLWTILVVLTLNLKPQRPQGSQEGGLLAHGLPKQHKYPLFISNLLLY